MPEQQIAGHPCAPPPLPSRIRRRSLRIGEVDHEALWLSVSTAAAGLGFFWLHFDLPVPPCTFHLITGQPCPGCGATRAMRQLMHGNLLGALHFNPLAVCMAAAVALFDVYAVIVLALRLPRIRIESVSPVVARRLRFATLSALGLNWLWLFYARV
ncbi:MAG TPA: DUF2752 domain-containing protein [Chthoniobacteraceae bacterium]|jgi:hypothetical protein